jgi:methylmalonyl-CoA/ethylmalonyl-CoA epimerase
MQHTPLPVAIRRQHHVGWIVPDESALDATIDALSLQILLRYHVEEFQAECIFLCPAAIDPEDTGSTFGLLELIVPSGGILAQFNKGQGGLHHVAYAVDDLKLATDSLIQAGLPPVEPSGVKAGPFLVSFLPPSVTRGLTIELVQCPSKEPFPESRRKS